MVPELSPVLTCPMGPSWWLGLFFPVEQCQSLVMVESPRVSLVFLNKPKKQKTKKPKTQTKQPKPLWTGHRDVMNMRALVLTSQEQAEEKQGHEGGK